MSSSPISLRGLTILAEVPEKRTSAAGEAETVGSSSERQPLTGAVVDNHVYQEIVKILKTEQQFELAGYKVNAIKRRLAARMRAVGVTDCQAYVQQLSGNAVEQQQLLLALSIHVSSFFRNPSAFHALDKKIIPSLVADSQRLGSKLRFWSVGCARGEEAYSLALVSRRFVNEGSQMAIIGTDISSDAIRTARRGNYCSAQLRNIAPDQLGQYFSSHGTQYRVAAEIRKAVRFFRHDIVTEKPFYQADLILCRNLLIYFARDLQRQVLESLAGALTPGGYLMLGRAETMAPDCRTLFQCVDPAERIYKRLNS